MEHEERLKAALADRYPVEREVGSGGMATVFLAKDLRHEREVAVKVFRPELAAALGSERFLREIKITAGLNHPHILPLLDSGEADSFLFYVMPYVDGESLREKLNREKQLSLEEALEITERVAGALSYAHSRDIVHRDIKPENILFQAGEVVVADFGIALAVDSAGGVRLTETGFSLGTPAYMSPEQVAGEERVDGRSDVYSLACVLYEMLGGDPPFIASNPRAVLAKHISDPAPPITTVRPNVPTSVVATLTTALEKAPADRFDSAKAFSKALFSVGVEIREDKKSIVVLPFENLSPDPDQDFFSDGLTEEVISDLSKIEALRVISRGSAMTFKGSNKKTPEIANELNVRYVLEGSVRRAGNSLRITAQLIDAERDVHLWSDKYTGTLEDVFDIQEKVSCAIAEALKVRLTTGEMESMAERPIHDAAAYECYLRAKAGSFEFTKEGIERSIQHLEDGLQLIGENALLYAGMAFAHVQLANIGAGHEESLAKGHEYVEKALALDPECAEAHVSHAWVVMLEKDIPGMIRSSRRALEIDANNVVALATLGSGYFYGGKISAAEPVCERLKRLDPIAFQTHWTQGGLAFYGGDFDRAVRLWRVLYERYPSAVYAPFSYGVALIYNGEGEAAFELMAETAAAHPGNAVATVGLVLVNAVQGNRSGVDAQMTPGFIKVLERDYSFAHHVAGAFALLGDPDEALKWLETAVAAGFANYPLAAEHDPLLESIRSDARFVKLMEKVKTAWEKFEI
jgi:serine/threonine protein kinase